MPTDLTEHARARLQQRGIPQIVVELLQAFGSSMRCGNAERLFFDKAARRRIAAYLGGQRGLQVIERWLEVYLVLGDNGLVVTVAHQKGRFRRP